MTKSEQEKLSTWLYCCDKLCEPPDLSDCETMAGMAEQLEADVERLRQQIAEMTGAYVKDIMPMIDNLSLHQAAVAEVRTLLARGPKYWAHVDEFYAILDKLQAAGL